MAFFVFQKTFIELDFFKGQPLTFIAWICPLLKPLLKGKNNYVFYEDDDISCIYFFKNGKAGYVLPRHRNMVYLNLSEGYHFGVSCIIGSFIKKDSIKFDLDTWIGHREILKRQFTIQCQEDCEILAFSL